MRFTNFAVALLLFGFLGVANAEVTGNELYSQLKSNDAHEQLIAYAYLKGVLDTEDFYLFNDAFTSADPRLGDTVRRFTTPHFCLSNSKVTLGQIKDIILKYLEVHPDKRNIGAHALIRFALMESFACANNPIEWSK